MAAMPSHIGSTPASPLDPERAPKRCEKAASSRSPWGDRALTREDILDAGQVAELLGLRRSTIEDYGRRGLLPVVQLGRHRRYLRADVEQLILSARQG